MPNWWRMAIDLLIGSWLAAFSGSRNPYLKGKLAYSQKLYSNCKEKMDIKTVVLHLLVNSWWVIRVEYPNLEILATCGIPQHRICCKTKSFSNEPGICLLFGLIQRMKCGDVVSRCCNISNSWSCNWMEDGINCFTKRYQLINISCLLWRVRVVHQWPDATGSPKSYPLTFFSIFVPVLCVSMCYVREKTGGCVGKNKHHYLKFCGNTFLLTLWQHPRLHWCTFNTMCLFEQSRCKILRKLAIAGWE